MMRGWFKPPCSPRDETRCGPLLLLLLLLLLLGINKGPAKDQTKANRKAENVPVARRNSVIDSPLWKLRVSTF